MNDKPTCAEPGCNSTILVDRLFCWNHSPSVSPSEREAARVKGGAASRDMLKARPEDLEKHLPTQDQDGALQAQLIAIAALKAKLERDPSDVRAAVALSGASKRLSQQLTACDLEQRVKELETALGKRKRKR